MGQISNSIKMAIFKALRRLDTTLTLPVVSPGSLHMNKSIDNIFYVDRVDCSVSRCYGSREVISVTWRRVKVECYCLPATTLHAISHVTFPAFDFSIVSYMRFLSNFKVIIVFR